MIHYLRYCCAMFFALFGFLLATPLSAQAQTREAYVSQSADETTLTFYYDTLRATRTGTTWGIGETKKEGYIPVPAWAGTSQEVDTTTTRVVFDASFRDFRPTTTAKWFYRCEALKQIEGLEYLNTSEVKDMCRMFYGCSALTTINSNRAWPYKVSRDMFAGCTKLKGAVAYDENKTDATMANPETGYFTAKSTAVESVRFGADSAQHIYTLQGKRVRGEWKHLPAGVYVVNGKKTVKP